MWPSLISMEDKTREAVWQDMEDVMNEIKEECGGIQVVIQHSPVGASAANRAIEKAIQRVEGRRGELQGEDQSVSSHLAVDGRVCSPIDLVLARVGP